MSLSRMMAAVTVFALVGGGLGLLAGFALGAGNPFYYAAAGIAAEAVASIFYVAFGGGGGG